MREIEEKEIERQKESEGKRGEGERERDKGGRRGGGRWMNALHTQAPGKKEGGRHGGGWVEREKRQQRWIEKASDRLTERRATLILSTKAIISGRECVSLVGGVI